MKSRRIRGHLLTPTRNGGWIDRRDAVIEIGEEGRVRSLRAGGPAAEDYRPHLLFPGFVDTHAHAPQHPLAGAKPGDLLGWLRTWVFPVEARFRGKGADEFFEELLRHGTMAGAFYASAWPESVIACRDAMRRLGIRGWVGMPLMDLEVYRPDLKALSLRRRTRRVVAEMETVAREDGEIRVSVTPRFALSCSDELLEAAGGFDLPVQTHISEHEAEVARVRRRGKDYLSVYERAGLLRNRCILAHGVWLTSDEWRRIRRAGASLAHCPAANLFLGSGVLDWREAWKGRVTLGTDVAGGPSHSLYDAMRTAWAVHAARWGRAPSPQQLLEAATVQGGRALGEDVGTLEPGMWANLQILDRNALLAGRADSLDDLLSRIVHRGGAHAIRARYVAGRRMREKIKDKR